MGVLLRPLTFHAIQFGANAFCSLVFIQHPFSIPERRVMTDVLVMTAVEFHAPMAIHVSVELHYPAFHQADPLRRAPTGRHQKNMDSEISQQTPEAITRGSRC